MHYVAQAVEFITAFELLLSLSYGRQHSETESGLKVNLNPHRQSVLCGFEVLLHKPLVLLLEREVAVVEHDGIIGLA